MTKRRKVMLLRNTDSGPPRKRTEPLPRQRETAPRYRSLFRAAANDTSNHTVPPAPINPGANLGFADARNNFLLAVLTNPALRLRATEIRTAALLGMYASHPVWRETGDLFAWPSVQFIGEQLELKIETVHRALAVLADHGHIAVVGRRYRLIPQRGDLG